jgi:Ca2+/Na+ antiporter
MTRRAARTMLALLIAVAIVAVWASLETLVAMVWPALLLAAALVLLFLVMRNRDARRRARRA